MNHKIQRLNGLKDINKQLNNRDKISLCQINIKSVYSSPSIYLLGKVTKKTAGVGDGNQPDLFTNQPDAS